MTLYIDYIFIENLIIDYLLLLQTKGIIKEKATTFRMVISSLIGSIYVCMMFILNLSILNYTICKLLLSFVIVYVAFMPKKIATYLKEITIFYFVSIINTGVYLVIITIFNLDISNNVTKIGLYVVRIYICIYY